MPPSNDKLKDKESADILKDIMLAELERHILPKWVSYANVACFIMLILSMVGLGVVGIILLFDI